VEAINSGIKLNKRRWRAMAHAHVGPINFTAHCMFITHQAVTLSQLARTCFWHISALPISDRGVCHSQIRVFPQFLDTSSAPSARHGRVMFSTPMISSHTLLCKKILTFCSCSQLQQAQRYAKLLAPSKKVSYQTLIVD
jgi:hypothetical protein